MTLSSVSRSTEIVSYIPAALGVACCVPVAADSVCLCLSPCPSVCPSSLYLSLLSVCLSVSLSLPVCLSVLSLSLSVCLFLLTRSAFAVCPSLSLSLSVCLCLLTLSISVFLSVCLSLCLCLSLSLSVCLLLSILLCVSVCLSLLRLWGFFCLCLFVGCVSNDLCLLPFCIPSLCLCYFLPLSVSLSVPRVARPLIGDPLSRMPGPPLAAW